MSAVFAESIVVLTINYVFYLIPSLFSTFHVYFSGFEILTRQMMREILILHTEINVDPELRLLSDAVVNIHLKFFGFFN